MSSPSIDYEAIEAFLAKSDPPLGRLIDCVKAAGGPQRISRDYASHFEALARAIVSQQLSVKAVEAIYNKFRNCVGGDIAPEVIARISVERLRQAGLSTSKARYIHNLAEWFLVHGSHLDNAASLTDEALVQLLTQIPGIGMWTVQMFLLFYLKRLDILPLDDLGVRKGVQLVYGLKKIAARGYVERAAKKWRPYRSIACLYMWRAFDLGIHKMPGWNN